MKLYVHSLVDKLKWFYENARRYNKIYNVYCCFNKEGSTDNTVWNLFNFRTPGIVGS